MFDQNEISRFFFFFFQIKKKNQILRFRLLFNFSWCLDRLLKDLDPHRPHLESILMLAHQLETRENWRPQQLPELIDKIQRIVDMQLAETVLAPSESHFCISKIFGPPKLNKKRTP